MNGGYFGQCSSSNKVYLLTAWAFVIFGDTFSQSSANNKDLFEQWYNKCTV
jgi:hypothetical protein